MFLRVLFLLFQVFFIFNIYAVEIKEISIENNYRVENETILNYLGLKVGDKFEQSSKNKAIKNLYSTSFFDQIKLEFNKGKLNIFVEEAPLISKINFKGSQKSKTSKFIEDMSTKKGDFYMVNKLEHDVEKIKETYRRMGRYLAEVNCKVTKEQNRRVSIEISINEGPKTGIRKIKFVGNDRFKSEDLKKLIASREMVFYRFFASDDTFDPYRIDYDKELLKEFYNSKGYADFRVISSSVVISPTKEFFTLTFFVEEGELYKFGDIKIHSKIQGFNTKILEKKILTKKGEDYNKNLVEDTTSAINFHLEDNGFPQVKAYPEYIKASNNNIVDIIYKIERAHRAYLGRLNFNGNTRTYDKIVRNQFQIHEGDLIENSKVRSGLRRIANLDFFDYNIKDSMYESGQGRYDFIFKLSEKSTADIGLNGGYDTSSGFSYNLSLNERNLFGLGREFSVGLNGGSKGSRNYYLSISDPSFMDSEFTTGISLYQSDSSSSIEKSYSKGSKGSSVNIGYSINDYITHNLRYQIKQETIKSDGKKYSKNKKDIIKKPYNQVELLFYTQEGSKTSSNILSRLTLNSLDRYILPKSGFRGELSQQFSGIGGSVKYLKNEIELKLFKSFINDRITMKLSLEGGAVSKIGKSDLRDADLFSLGEPIMRGFAPSGMGPREKGIDKKGNRSLNGKYYYLASTELIFNIKEEGGMNVSALLFADIGALWSPAVKKDDDSFYDSRSPNASIGAGLIFHTSILPIRFDFGIPIRKKHYDNTQVISFSASTKI